MVNEVRPTGITPEERERLEAAEKARAEEAERARTLDVKEEDIVGDIDFPLDTGAPPEVEKELEVERRAIAERERERIEVDRLRLINLLEKNVEELEDIPQEDRPVTEKTIRENIAQLKREVDPEVIETLIKRQGALASATRIQIENIKRRGFIVKPKEIVTKPEVEIIPEKEKVITEPIPITFKPPFVVQPPPPDTPTTTFPAIFNNAFNAMNAKIAEIQSAAYSSKLATDLRNVFDTIINNQIFPADTTMKEYLDPKGFQGRKDYEDAIDIYANDVVSYNSQVNALNESAEKVLGELSELPIDEIEAYSAEIEALNDEAEQLDDTEKRLNPLDIEGVANYNLAVGIYNERAKTLERKTTKINKIISDLDGTNAKVSAVNAQVERLGTAPVLPDEPQTTLPGLTYMIGASIAKRYAEDITEASKEKTSTPEKVASNIVSVIDTTKTLFVPGFWIKNIKDMKSSEIIINSLIDLVILLPFIKPGKTALSAINSSIARNANIFMGKITFKQLSPVLAKLSKAIQSGNRLKIIAAADELKTLGMMMKARKIPGGDNIISKATVIRGQARIIADTRKVTVPKQIDAVLKQTGVEIDSIRVFEQGKTLGAESLKKAVITKTKKGATLAEIPVTRSELKKLGITEKDAEKIFDKVGMDRKAFVKEVNKFRGIKTINTFDILNEGIKKLATRVRVPKLKGFDLRITKLPPTRQASKKAVDTLTESARKGIKKAGEQEAVKLALSRTYGETIQSWRNRVRQILKSRFPKADSKIIEKAVIDLTKPVPSGKTADIARKAREYQALMDRLAKKAIALLKRQATPQRVALTLNTLNLTNAVVGVASTSVLRQLYTSLTAEQQRQFATELSVQTARALANQNWTQAKALAKVASELEARAVASTLVKSSIETKADASIKAITKTITATEAKTATLELVKVKPIKAIITERPVPKPPVSPPKPVKPVKPVTPKARVTKPRLRLPIPTIKAVAEKKVIDKRIRKGAIAWRQGLFWIVVNAPYKSANDAFYLRQDNPPKGAEVQTGAGSAYKTIQQLTGKAPDQLVLDMGIMDITITSPAKPGTAGTIKYTRDKKQKTKSTINLKLTGVRR